MFAVSKSITFAYNSALLFSVSITATLPPIPLAMSRAPIVLPEPVGPARARRNFAFLRSAFLKNTVMIILLKPHAGF